MQHNHHQNTAYTHKCSFNKECIFFRQKKHRDSKQHSNSRKNYQFFSKVLQFFHGIGKNTSRQAECNKINPKILCNHQEFPPIYSASASKKAPLFRRLISSSYGPTIAVFFLTAVTCIRFTRYQ